MSMTKVCSAGVGSMFPAKSFDLTLKVKVSSGRFGYVKDVVVDQGAQIVSCPSKIYE